MDCMYPCWYMHIVIQHTCTVQSGTTAVLLACQFGHRELLEVLIDRYHCAATDKDKASSCMAHDPKAFWMNFELHQKLSCITHPPFTLQAIYQLDIRLHTLCVSPHPTPPHTHKHVHTYPVWCVRMQNGKSALWYAAANGHLPILRLLAGKYGCSSRVDERSDVCCACNTLKSVYYPCTYLAQCFTHSAYWYTI